MIMGFHQLRFIQNTNVLLYLEYQQKTWNARDRAREP